MLYNVSLPNNQWGKAISTAVYLKNRSPTKSLKGITPYESDTGGKPDLSNLRRFGCVAYHHNEDPKRTKLSNQGIKCVFLGYEGRNQYRLWDPAAHKVVRSSHVNWDELEASSSIIPLGEVELEWYDTDSEANLPSDIWSASTNFSGSNGSDRGIVDDGDHNIATDTPLENASISTSSSLSSRSQTPVLPEPQDIAEPEPVVHSGRPKRSAAKPTNYARLNDPWNNCLRNNNQAKASNESKRGFAVRACKINVGNDTPETYQEAIQCAEKDQWEEAMKEEFDSHQVNKTWELTELPQGRKVLPGRWVYRKKYGPTGAIERYKARWVVKGFHQIEGIDYDETFASVVKSMIWKSLLALGAKYDYEIEQLDIITAFLESLMKETVYVEQPHGFEEPRSARYARVCHLLRALYGLKQAPREWYLTLISYLINLGYKRLEHDHCVFGHENGVIIAIFVDDLLLLGPYLAEISNLKKQLGDRFRMRDMGPISWYLGMEVIRDRPNRTLYINQSAFTQRMLEDLEMEDCKSAKVPMDSGIELVKDVYQGQVYHATKEQIKGYQSFVSSLLWLACMTCLDISFSIRKCSQYASNPYTYS